MSISFFKISNNAFMLKDVYNVELVDRSFGSCGYNAAKNPGWIHRKHCWIIWGI